MGYVVFHLDKSPGNESAMTDHIERKVIHPNVDPERIHLNKELIEFPDGVKDRTEAIQHRLDTAGLKRQIGKNQVKVIRVMISGSPEDKNKAADVGSNIMDGIGSMIGTPKVKRQQQEIESLKYEKHELQQDIDGLTQTIGRERSERQQETMQLKAEIHKIHDWLPDTPTLIKWGEYCQKIGFSNTQAKDLINMRPVRFSGELYSTEHSQRFTVNDAEMRFDRGTEKSSGFRLIINGVSLSHLLREIDKSVSGMGSFSDLPVKKEYSDIQWELSIKIVDLIKEYFNNSLE